MAPVLDAVKWSFRQLGDKNILASVLVPCLIHSVLLMGGLYFIYSNVSDYLFAMEVPSYLQFENRWAWVGASFEFIFALVRWLVLLAICLGVVGIGLTVTTTIAHFIASPFNGWLSTKAEAQLRAVNHPEITVKQAFQLGFAREWQRLRYYGVRALPLGLLTLLLFWVPVVGSVISLLWFVFGAWMVGLQAVDYVADNNGLSFAETVKRCHHSRVSIVLLGALLMAMMLVPVLNLLSMAMSVLCGTYLWVKHDLD